jgi:hypothetical protein
LKSGATAVHPEKKESKHLGFHVFKVHFLCFSFLELSLLCGIEILSVSVYNIFVERERLSFFTFADYDGDEALWLTRRDEINSTDT